MRPRPEAIDGLDAVGNRPVASGRRLLDLVAGGVLTVVHDAALDLDGIVAAHRLVDGGRKRGNVIVRPTSRTLPEP